MVWLGLGTKTTWLCLGKDHGLVKIMNLLRLGELRHHYYRNNHVVKVKAVVG